MKVPSKSGQNPSSNLSMFFAHNTDRRAVNLALHLIFLGVRVLTTSLLGDIRFCSCWISFLVFIFIFLVIQFQRANNCIREENGKMLASLYIFTYIYIVWMCLEIGLFKDSQNGWGSLCNPKDPTESHWYKPCYSRKAHLEYPEVLYHFKGSQTCGFLAIGLFALGQKGNMFFFSFFAFLIQYSGRANLWDVPIVRNWHLWTVYIYINKFFLLQCRLSFPCIAREPI